jgi:uncharacterized membrane protein
MLWEYHGERWPVLLTDILRNALRAAYLSTSIQDYLTLALEALGSSTTFSEERQAVIYNNIMNILQVNLIKYLYFDFGYMYIIYCLYIYYIYVTQILRVILYLITEKTTKSRTRFAR